MQDGKCHNNRAKEPNNEFLNNVWNLLCRFFFYCYPRGDRPREKYRKKESENMKREELEKLGLSKEQVDSILDMHHREIDPVNEDLQTTKDDLKAANETVKTQKTTIGELKKDLEEFKDADVSGLEDKIETLEKDLKAKEAEHQQEIADRDFNDLLKESILAAKGKNIKAITALLDADTLKESKNQKEDITAAIKVLAEAEDSKMLFGETEPQVRRTGSIIEPVTGSGVDAEDAQMRAVMGLPPIPNTEQK